MNEILHGDSYDLIKEIPDGSIDLICTDPPYGITALNWDSFDLQAFWKETKRVIKENGAIIVFSTQPFTSELILSNKEWYRYEIIWEKPMITNFWFVKKQIAKCHENIEVFYQKQPTYNVIKQPSQFRFESNKIKKNSKKFDFFQGKDVEMNIEWIETGERYPRSVIKCSHDFSRHNGTNGKQNRHHTQKPLQLIKFLIETYTNKDDVVLDPFVGSGTTALACNMLNRKFLCIEKEKEFYDIACARLAKAQQQLTFDL